MDDPVPTITFSLMMPRYTWWRRIRILSASARLREELMPGPEGSTRPVRPSSGAGPVAMQLPRGGWKALIGFFP
ncbi:MAG TPA: hypothetical protein EYP43_00070 [Thermoplasmata archaeon]|nr:hypothetical protein [Thermoplasmata archaeon]